MPQARDAEHPEETLRAVLSLEEVQALLAAASPREHLVLRIFAVCGLRPAEVLALRIDDFEGAQLRIDEALKERQRGAARIGSSKTEESDSFVPVPLDIGREIAEWIAAHPERQDPRAFLLRIPGHVNNRSGVM